METQAFRAEVLASLGPNSTEIAELLNYNANVFEQTDVSSLTLPLPEEAFVTVWQEYAEEARLLGVVKTLQNYLPQFCFPIQEGISETEAYKNATRKGIFPPNSGALSFKSPEKIELQIHQSIAGKIPVLIVPEREDFVTLVRALVMKNEPRAIPDSMGACMVKGYNNWARIRRHRKEWEHNNPLMCTESHWRSEFQKLIPQKELYQDRFMLLSDNPYSAVPASDIGLSEEEWKRLSLIIRRAHECTHYFTLRVFSSMRNNLMDELIADYIGIVSAIGFYRADWFLRFVGLEHFPTYREGARLENYRGDPRLSDGAFRILQILVKQAAENLEQFDQTLSPSDRTLEGKAQIITFLTRLTLEELASMQGLYEVFKKTSLAKPF